MVAASSREEEGNPVGRREGLGERPSGTGRVGVCPGVERDPGEGCKQQDRVSGLLFWKGLFIFYSFPVEKRYIKMERFRDQ